MGLRFHLDEHIHPAIANGLRERGVDVTSTLDAGLRSASDESQLQHALSLGRVFVTQDQDFLRLHASGVSHAGIVYWRQGGRSIGESV
jgi:predicted nuclease of predicted toxin-antitoxin system